MNIISSIRALIEAAVQHNAQTSAKFLYGELSFIEQLRVWVQLPHFHLTVTAPVLLSVMFARLWVAQPVTWIFPRAGEFAGLTALSFLLTMLFYASGHHGYGAVVILPLYPPVLAIYMFRASRMLQSQPSSLVVDSGFFASITYITCLVIDIPSALITGIGIVGVGSAGFQDGLVLYPVGAFVLIYAFFRCQQLLLRSSGIR